MQIDTEVIEGEEKKIFRALAIVSYERDVWWQSTRPYERITEKPEESSWLKETTSSR